MKVIIPFNSWVVFSVEGLRAWGLVDLSVCSARYCSRIGNKVEGIDKLDIALSSETRVLGGMRDNYECNEGWRPV